MLHYCNKCKSFTDFEDVNEEEHFCTKCGWLHKQLSREYNR